MQPLHSSPSSTQDPPRAKQADSKIKKFRYHEYKYPVEKLKRRESTPSKRRAPRGRPRPDPAADSADTQYAKALHQQQWFLQLQDDPTSLLFDEQFASPTMSQHNSPVPPEMMSCCSPRPILSSPLVNDQTMRCLSGGAGLPPVYSANVSHNLQPPAHRPSHSRASSWGGAHVKLEDTMISLPPYLGHDTATLPPILRSQSLAAMAPTAMTLPEPISPLQVRTSFEPSMVAPFLPLPSPGLLPSFDCGILPDFSDFMFATDSLQTAFS